MVRNIQKLRKIPSDPYQSWNKSPTKNSINGSLAKRSKAPSGKRSELIAATIRGEIASGRWAPDTYLPPETDIAERFQVSRPSIREALRILESEGLIRVVRGQRGGVQVLLPQLASLSRYAGAYLQMHGATLQEVFDARILVEPLIVKQITLAQNQDAFFALDQCIAALRTAFNDQDAQKREELRFQEILCNYADSAALKMLASLLHDVIEWHLENVHKKVQSGMHPRAKYTLSDFQDGVHAKVELLKTMRKGAAERAQAMWRTYIAIYTQRSLESVSDSQGLKVYI